jgi:hypothetical protein
MITRMILAIAFLTGWIIYVNYHRNITLWWILPVLLIYLAILYVPIRRNLHAHEKEPLDERAMYERDQE